MLKEGCPGSQEIRSPHPEEFICYWCDAVNEIWSDEVDIQCKSCNKTISRNIGTTCLEWCPAARECVGAEKYDRLMKAVQK